MKILNGDLYTTTLHSKSEEITDFDDGLKSFSKELIKTLNNSETGVGLAAVQVGKLIRMFILKSKEHGTLIICNPIIVSAVGRMKWKEGCLSFPGKLKIKLRRSVTVLDYQDITGKKIKKTFLQLDSACVLHEIDHLNGITFLD